ncbi:MAG: putative toxin-antitoxin system toxin component, PIN family [Spirochaetaceae bacterium]|nr:MAG: putative toxin-antitoxin system toxin component, PIN family [Spirochaetaceae bacterium]
MTAWESAKPIWPVSWPRPGVLTVLDTSVLISALLFRGEIAGIHRAILEGRLQPLVTEPILKEYLRVLAYPKLRLSQSEIKYLLDEEIRPWFHRISEDIPNDVWMPEDPSDDQFVNAARVRPETHLISGDGHILQARERLPVPVLTARELLDQLER